MRVSTPDGKSFTLVRETDADRALIDALDIERHVFVEGVVRRPYHNEQGGIENNAALLVVSRTSQEALRAEAGRQALSTLGDLSRLLRGDTADHGHVGDGTTNPHAQEQLAAVTVQLQSVLQSLSEMIIEHKAVLKEMVRAHGVPPVVFATVAQGGAA